MYIDRDEYIWRSPLHLAVMKGDIALPMVRALLTMSRATDINLPSHCDSKYKFTIHVYFNAPYQQTCMNVLIFRKLDMYYS